MTEARVELDEIVRANLVSVARAYNCMPGVIRAFKRDKPLLYMVEVQNGETYYVADFTRKINFDKDLYINEVQHSHRENVKLGLYNR